MQTELSADRFRECLNQTFRLSVSDQSLDAELIQVRGLKSDSARQDKTPFSILLRGPKGVVIDQQIMRLENETLGEHHLFLVPVGPDPDDEERGILYEAVFT